jgi:hypothetical protein
MEKRVSLVHMKKRVSLLHMKKRVNLLHKNGKNRQRNRKRQPEEPIKHPKEVPAFNDYDSGDGCEEVHFFSVGFDF